MATATLNVRLADLDEVKEVLASAAAEIDALRGAIEDALAEIDKGCEFDAKEILLRALGRSS